MIIMISLMIIARQSQIIAINSNRERCENQEATSVNRHPSRKSDRLQKTLYSNTDDSYLPNHDP